MIDKKYLSKIKCLYSIKCDQEGRLHIERCPVVYINKEYIYFKNNSGSKMLSWISFDRVKSSLEDLENDLDNITGVTNIFEVAGRISGYYFNVGDFNKVKDIKVNFRKILDRSRLNRAKNDLDYAREKYEKAKDEYNKIYAGAAVIKVKR